jgi:uncharacterized membrane protein HdeD (DUF308 family)
MSDRPDGSDASGDVQVPGTRSMSRTSWELALRGVLILVFGVLAVTWDDIDLEGMAWYFGILVLMEAVFQMVGSFNTKADDPKWSLVFLGGLVSLVIALVVISWQDITDELLLGLIGAWALLLGVGQVVYAGMARDGSGGTRGLMFGGGVVAIVFGLVAFLWPDATALSIVETIGVVTIIIGVHLVVLGAMVRKR